MNQSKAESGVETCRRLAQGVADALGRVWRTILLEDNGELNLEVVEKLAWEDCDQELRSVFNWFKKRELANTCSVEDWLTALSEQYPIFLKEDLKFHFYQYLSERYLSPSFDETSEYLARLCELCNGRLRVGNLAGSQPNLRPKKDLLNNTKFFFGDLAESQVEAKAVEITTGFLLLANSVGYVTKRVWSSTRGRTWNKDSNIEIKTGEFDFEYLRSVLFGLSPAIPGLNGLFGGGGPYFFKRCSGQAGRLFVLEGGVGMGKSTLAISFAAEIARKGGIAWIIPFEQTPEDCQGYIRDHRLIPYGYGVNIANGGIGYDQLVRSGFNGGSILIAQGAKETFEKVFNDIFEMDDSMPQDVLRVVIIDPINAINTSETLGSRDALLSFISEARRRHLNVVATAESQVWVQDKAVELFEKLADVVIRLSRNDPTSGYSQRFLEIVKSRRQREQRGQHPYSIRSGTGIHVYPSSAAIAARYQERKSKRSEPDVFGWRPIDEILGPAAFLPGDVMVFRGPEGALKTELAVAFALCCGNRHGVARARACSLFVPLKDPVGFIQGLVSRKLRGSALVRTGDGDTLRSSENVEILDLPGGYIQPGVFFSILESKINEIRSRGNFVERIVFDNVEHWDSDCPFIAADPTFASTLVKLLRRRGITTLMVSHVLPETASTGRIQHSLLAAADVTIKFWRYDHAGKEQNAFRVVATRSMEHDWDQYSIYMEHRQLKVGVKAKQFRFEGSKATPVPVKLHLHSEGVIQEIYNNELAQSLRPVLARDVFVHADNQGRIVKWLDMQALAMVDQVQILELDEFQLPRAKKDLPELPRVLSEIRLANRRSQSFSKFVDELQHSLAERIKIPTGNAINTSTPKPLARYFAMPYYQNLGLLVINRAHSFWKTIAAGKKSNEDELTWESIARYAMMWEADSAKNDRLFFDFQSNKSETYISFFFEMAMGMGIETPQKGASLAEWFSGYKSLIKRLLANYWLLGHRAHRAHPEEYYRFDREGKVEHKKNWKKEDLESKPIFWRHWFTTAAELFAQFSPECWPMLEVRMLPGGGAVAGEWYLTIPASSAAPEFAAEIIKHLISKDDEIERLRLGVGLPVRASFYEMEEGGLDMLRCRYFSLPARETGERLSRALRRSDIRDYSSVSRLLSFHLKRVLELERDEAESALLARDWQGTGNDAIEGILDSLISGLTKIRIPD